MKLHNNIKSIMSELQLEENVQNVISTIIQKYPTIETDILYLRTVFIDQTKNLHKQLLKSKRKYNKIKEKLNSNQVPQTGKFIQLQKNMIQSSKQRKFLSPKHYEKIKEVTQPQNNYQIDLMALVLSQAKSIKQIFDSLMKRQLQGSTTIPISKVMNLHTVYKQFYRSFKQRHKQYIENFSYDERQIHKNSTTMKQRLLDELKAETKKRKELQKLLQDLQQSMGQSLKLKDKQLQKLNKQLEDLMKTSQKKLYASQTCTNCQQHISPNKIMEISKKIAVKKGKRSFEQVTPNLIINSDSRQCKSSIPDNNQQDPENHLSISSDQQSRNPSDDENPQQNRDIGMKKNDQNLRVSKANLKANRSNLGKFYLGNQTIMTGKINQTQSNLIPVEDKKKPNEPNSFASNALVQNYSPQTQNTANVTPQKNTKPSLQPRITFGFTPNQIQQRILPSMIQEYSDIKNTDNRQKQNLLASVMLLKQQLKKEQQQKINLQQKIKQSDAEYKKLQAEVNQLYKMIKSPQKQEVTQKVIQNFAIDKNNQKYQKYENKSKEKINFGNQSQAQNKNTPINMKNQFIDDCQDYEQIIARAQKTLLQNPNTNFLSPSKQTKKAAITIKNSIPSKNNKNDKELQNNCNQQIFNQKDSQFYQVQQNLFKNDRTNKNNQTNEFSNVNLVNIKSNKLSIDPINLSTISRKDRSNLSISPNKLNISASSPKNIVKHSQSAEYDNLDENEVKIGQTKQIYHNKQRYKSQRYDILNDKSQQLMLMLLVQSISIEQFLQKESSF